MNSLVLVRVDGQLGRLTLNRPSALNALAMSMIVDLERALRTWMTDPAIACVTIDSANERAFCAGGDIRWVYRMSRSAPEQVHALWTAQHRLDALIATYPKPVVTVMNGLTLGGGMGIGCHASHRVVRPGSQLAMPEVNIGLAPDVGGHHLLARSPGMTGRHLALTSTRASAEDALYAGLADYLVGDEGDVTQMRDRLASGQHPDGVLADLAGRPDGGQRTWLASNRGWIDSCYDSDDPLEILRRLRECSHTSAQMAAQRIEAMSPTAVAVSLAAFGTVTPESTLLDMLRQDLRRNVHFLEGDDFREGMRAAVVDKDHAPRWSPPRLEDVTSGEVASYFAPLATGELDISEFATDSL